MTINETEKNSMTTPNLSRRSLLKTGAWTVPAVLVATAVPLASASPNDVAQIDLLSDIVGDGQVAEGQLLDSDGQGVDGVSVIVNVLSGPLAPALAVAVSQDGGYFAIPQVSTLSPGDPATVAQVQITAGSAQRNETLTVLPD